MVDHRDDHDDRSPAAILRAALTEQVRTIVSSTSLLGRDTTSVDEIHAARLATRRLRSLLRTFGAVVDEKRCDAVRDELRWLADQLGAVRDWDVFIDGLHAEREHLDERHHPGVNGVIAHCRAARGHAADELRASLASRRSDDLQTSLITLVEDLPELTGTMSRGDLRRAIDVDIRRLSKGARRLDRNSSLADLHRLRILTKRARHATEVSRPAGASAQLVDRLRKMQDTLGKLHDAAVAQDRLRDLAASASSSEAFACGFLAARAANRAERLRGRWRQRWRQARRALPR